MAKPNHTAIGANRLADLPSPRPKTAVLFPTLSPLRNPISPWDQECEWQTENSSTENFQPTESPVHTFRPAETADVTFRSVRTVRAQITGIAHSKSKKNTSSLCLLQLVAAGFAFSKGNPT